MADVNIDMVPWQSLRLIPKSVFSEWARRYRMFAAKRFIRLRSGGGSWRALHPITIEKRIQRRKYIGGITDILYETGTLLGALSPKGKAKGSLQRFIKNGVRVGYGGADKHPLGDGLTIAKIASIHQGGLERTPGRIPARPIIVDPPKRVLDDMAQDVVKHWKSLGR